MNQTEKNLREILGVLMQTEDFVTLETLSVHADISRRSVQNYLTRIENWLLDNGLTKFELQKKQGYGIRLILPGDGKIRLLKLLQDEDLFLEDKLKRRVDVLKTLVFSDEELTIQFLADQYYVSRSIIQCDLEWASQWLAKHDLQLFKTQRRGIGLTGSELARRNAIAAFFDMYRPGGKAEVDVVSPFPSRIPEQDLQRLLEVYEEDDIEKVSRIIEEAEEKFEFFLLDEYFTSILTHIVISISRLKRGKKVDKEFSPPEGNFPQLEMNTAQFIALRLKAVFQITLPESEILYVCIHLMGYNAFRPDNNQKPNIPAKIEYLAARLIEAVDAQTGEAYTKDKLLFFGIAFHLKNSIYHLGESVYSPVRGDLTFPENAQALRQAVQKAGFLYEMLCGLHASDEELISLTHYFLLSQKRNRQKKKALLVCNYGILTQVEILEDLTSALPNIQISDVCTSYQLQHIELGGYNFLITTVPLELGDKPCADLSRVAQHEYVSFLEEFLANEEANAVVLT